MLLSLGRRAPASDLVDLLLECHGRIRSFVGLASEVGRRLELPAAQVEAACLRCERYFSIALPLHVLDEEQSVLPRLHGLAPELDEALDRMHLQHDEHQAPLRSLLEALEAVRAAPASTALRARLRDEAGALGADFEAHLGNEELRIFPVIRARLAPEVQARILAELRDRRA